jgi:hypothetical protein
MLCDTGILTRIVILKNHSGIIVHTMALSQKQ